MEREKALWTARAGDYSGTDHPDALLALRIEDLSSREATQWVALQSQSDGRQAPDADATDDADSAEGTVAETPGVPGRRVRPGAGGT